MYCYADLSHALMLPIPTWPLWLIVPPIHQYTGMRAHTANPLEDTVK